MKAELIHALRGITGSQSFDAGFFQEHVDFLQAWMAAIQENRYYAR